MKGSFRFLFLLTVIACMGLGCKKPVINTDGTIPDASQNTGSQTIAVQNQRNDIAVPKDFSKEIGLIRQALSNLGQAQSFRAELNLPGQNTRIDAALDFNRSQGVRGRIAMPGANGVLSAEIYLNENTILFKDGMNPWQDVTQTAEGERLSGVLKQAFAFDSSQSSGFSINDSAYIANIVDDPSGCRLYDLIQSTNGNIQTLRICITDDIATGIDIDTVSGLVRIRYKDVNGNVPIEKPKL
ncbi:hypothetical protein IT407_02005 [Candidatus Uhrbacteria bacterium]|nr:hypothetical protein [Candidatus Uhrbacteria bacterium]